MRSMSVRSARRMQAVLVALAGTLGSASSALAESDASVAQAQHLLESGKVVEARSMLMSLKAQGPSGADADRVVELLGAADRRLRLMDETELSLQKAELAVAQGELRVAETHANAVLRSDKADPAARERASNLLDQAAAIRDQLSPMIAPTLDQAVRDFDAGRYAEAKAGLASIVRTGVKLSQQQMTTVNRYQDRLYDLERTQGHPFDAQYVPLSVMRSAGQALAAAATGAQDQNPPAEQPAPAPNQPQAGDDLLDEAARFDADRVLNEAEAAFKAGRYNEASEKFTLATTTYSKYLTAEQTKSAQDRLAEARALLGTEGAGAADSFINSRRVQIGEATATFENLVTQAKAAKDRGDIQAARNYAAQARLGWNNAYANGLFSEEQYRQRAGQIDQLVRDIDGASEAQTVAEIQRREQQLKSEEAKVRAQQESERQARINENLDRLRALQIEQKYEEALQVVEQVLFLDPTNPSALLLKDVLKDVILYREFDAARRQRGLSYAKEVNEIEKSLIVPESVLAYPPDWPELSFRRGEIQSFVESEADRKVLATLETRRIPASFKDNSLQDVLAFVATVTNVQMDVNWDSLSQLGIEPDKQISLELREVPARVVLDRILEKAQPDSFSKAGWAVNDGVLVIAADEALRRNTFVVIYDIRDLLFQIPNYNEGPKLDLDQVLNQGQQGGGGGGGGIFEDEDDAEPDGLTEQQLMQRVLEIIQTNVDFEGWRDNGGSTGVVQELNGNLIITNTARNHRSIQGLLTQLREIRSVQINVESRFLTVAQDFFEQIGFDLDVYFNADNDQFKAVKRQLEAFGQGSLTNEGLSAYPSDIVTGRNGQNTGYTFTGLDANGNPQYAFQAQPYSIPAPSNTSVIPVQQNSTGITTDLITAGGTAFAQSVLAAGNPAIAIAGTFLDDVQVDFLMEATQADQRNVTLSAPRLTFSNGRAANISVVNQVGFVSALNPVVGAGSVAFNPTIGRINSGFTLLVRGVASADRRYVTLTVETGVSGRPTFQSQTFTAVAGQGGDNQEPAVATGTIQIPTIDVTQVNTGVTIPDRGTVLLGGQRLANEIEIETGVPILSKLPILSRFFTNRAESREERTLLILMKPTIVIQNEEEEKNFPGLLDKLRNPFR